MFSDSLAAALNETELLLGEMSVMTRHQTPKVESCAVAVDALDRTVQAEVEEAQRYCSLLDCKTK